MEIVTSDYMFGGVMDDKKLIVCGAVQNVEAKMPVDVIGLWIKPDQVDSLDFEFLRELNVPYNDVTRTFEQKAQQVCLPEKSFLD